MRISILFSTRNRGDMLARTLEAMSQLEGFAGEFEVIVGDNGSTDHTPQVLQDFAQKMPLRSFVVATPGKNRVLNRAVDLARGEFLIFTDDDVLPEPNWLAAYWEASEAFPEEVAFGGRIEPVFPEDTPAWVSSLSPLVQKFAYSRFDAGVPLGPMRNSPTGPNMAIRRRVFEHFRYNETIGPAGSNYAMGSETELLARLRDAGHGFIYVPQARVGHIVRPEQVTLEWLAGRAFRLGRGQMASTQLTGHVAPLVLRSFVQGAASLPAYLVTLPMSDARRFWGTWHWKKSVGRLAQLRATPPQRAD